MQRTKPHVAIVLATYNGQEFLDQQISSIQAQEYREWSLLVRDDGSSDSTRERLQQWTRRDPRITVLPSGDRLGVIGNFGELVATAHRLGAEYVLPCDQDDVWEPRKVSMALAAARRVEGEHGCGTPVLVHSDLRVVDETLHTISASFMRYQGIAHVDSNPLEILLVQNFVTGCASLLNRSLAELALPVPSRCVMHDWWFALCAAARGIIAFQPDTPILYRQHRRNEVGAAGVFGRFNPLTRRGRRRLAESWAVPPKTIQQACALRERLCERGCQAAERLDVITAYSRIDRERPLHRLVTLRRYGIRAQTSLRTGLLAARLSTLGTVPP